MTIVMAPSGVGEPDDRGLGAGVPALGLLL